MNCSRCDFPLGNQHGFCPRCGAAYRPTGERDVGAAQVPLNVTSGSVQSNARAKAFLVIGAVVLVLAILVVSIPGNKQKSPPSSQPSNETDTPPATTNVAEQPTTRPPKFMVYRSKLDQGTSVVVSPSTSDEQLKSLLWFFREKVRSHRFKDVGISQPTSKQWGQKGYLSGMIVVYKGSKCASELFSDSGLGPCGYGDHSAAEYQWGLLVDGVFNTDADSGEMTTSDGTTLTVFDYHDHWQPPADLQGRADAEK